KTPAVGSVLSATHQQFTWNNGGGTSLYALWLGTTSVGSNNLYISPKSSALSATVTLPANGIQVFARLYTLVGTTWLFNDYAFIESGTPVPPVLTAPALGSTLSSTSQTFTWTAGTGITSYQFGLGTTGVGSLNLYLSPRQSALTATVTGLPANGVTVFARLAYLQGTVWKSLDYTFIESGTPTLPVLSSPNTFGTTFTTSSTTFTWTAGAGPTAYELWVGK